MSATKHTPRTDAALTEDGNGDKRHVPADFARRLELEASDLLDVMRVIADGNVDAVIAMAPTAKSLEHALQIIARAAVVQAMGRQS